MTGWRSEHSTPGGSGPGPGRPQPPRWQPAVDERFAAARLWAAGHAPYLAHAVFALNPVVLEPNLDQTSGTPAPDERFRALPADTRWNIHLDPGTVLATPAEQLGWWVLHQVGHLVRGHARRSPWAGHRAAPAPRHAAGDHDQGDAAGGHRHQPGDAVAGYDGPADLLRRWHRAADAEVNDDMAADGAATPPGVLCPADLGLPEGRTAEEYLSLIEELETLHGTGWHPLAEAVDCGSGCDGVDRDYEDAAAGSALTDLQRGILELAVAREIEARAAARSAVPGGWLRWAGQRRNPSAPWRSLLSALVRRGVHHGSGRVDFSYRRPSRRSAAGGRVLLPAMVTPVPQVAMVVDTSGSVAPAELQRFLDEITAIVATACGARRRLRVICCDRHAHPVQEVRRAEEIRLVGGGGTDLREGLAAAQALRPRPDLIVVLTDGETPWPDRRPPLPVVVAMVGSPPRGAGDAGSLWAGSGVAQSGTAASRASTSGAGSAAPAPPAWASTVHLPDTV